VLDARSTIHSRGRRLWREASILNRVLPVRGASDEPEAPAAVARARRTLALVAEGLESRASGPRPPSSAAAAPDHSFLPTEEL